ncbi:MAG TPA: Na+/H+ antiporter NhaC family protein [Halanaerobiales bacterium]|nr:Na+/H+ antiporter NhaC family protein [Halanaerobiales bacterium]
MEEYGILTLLPPLIAILLAFLTKRVLISLFIGIFSGALIITGGNPLAGVGYTLDAITESMTSSWNVRLLLFNLLMGSGVAFIWKLGGSQALATWAQKKIDSRRAAGVGAWVLGMIVFFNDYVNAAIVGNAFRDIFEKLKISTEKLSYILDSTAAPVATFFISDWIAFQIGMIKSGIDTAGIEGVDPFTAYIRSVPYNLYCILAVIFVGIIVISNKDFGPMLKAEHRAITENKQTRDGATPMMDVGYELGEPKDIKPMLKSFFYPIIALIVVSITGMWWTGRPGENIMEILGNSAPAKALLWGAFAMTVVGFVMALTQKIMNLEETMETFMDGLKLMLMACVILVLAWTLGSITETMDLAGYIVSLLGDSVSYAFLPLVIFATGMLVAFATGTSWGTMTILTPIAIPLGFQITGDPHKALILAGVVFSGAIFGDHCSPISDTTVLSSIFSGADHMDHVSTQIPYAITVASVAAVLYLLYGFFGLSPLILIPLGIISLVILAYTLSNYFNRKYGLQDSKYHDLKA